MEATEDRGFGPAWMFLCGALAVHVLDEALTGFLSVYNPTVMAVKDRLPWFPAPVFRFDVWLGGLIAAVIVLLGLGIFAYRGSRAMRLAATIFAVIMLLNAAGHTAGTILGRTVESVRFPRPMPGTYSSPLLLVAAIYLLLEVRRASHAGRVQAAQPGGG